MKTYKLLPYFASLFCVALVISNIIASKIWSTPWGFTAPSGVILFPIVYIIGDVIPEVYDFSVAKKVIWLGFALNLLAVVAFEITIGLPYPPFYIDQNAMQVVLGSTPRLLIASFCAYLVGQYTNAWIMVKVKQMMNSRLLWVRTISSTIVGETFDSTIFITIAFLGVVPTGILPIMILTQALLKTLYETCATPLTYLVVTWAKKVEGVEDQPKRTGLETDPAFS